MSVLWIIYNKMLFNWFLNNIIDFFVHFKKLFFFCFIIYIKTNLLIYNT